MVWDQLPASSGAGRTAARATALSLAFKAEGTTHVFGMMGDGNMYWQYANEKNGIKMHEVRHEGVGLGMADGVLRVVPEAKVGHVGVYRNETSLEPVPYYAKFPPEIADGTVRIELVTRGSPKFNIFQERNKADQPELEREALFHPAG